MLNVKAFRGVRKVGERAAQNSKANENVNAEHLVNYVNGYSLQRSQLLTTGECRRFFHIYTAQHCSIIAYFERQWTASIKATIQRISPNFAEAIRKKLAQQIFADLSCALLIGYNQTYSHLRTWAPYANVRICFCLSCTKVRAIRQSDIIQRIQPKRWEARKTNLHKQISLNWGN